LVGLGYYNINSPARGVLKTMNIIEKVKHFLKEVYVELKRVSWLSRKDAFKYTMIVLAVTIIVAAFLGGLDYIFTEILKRFIVKQF
jgi:preprotein translocase subunit SecE